MVKGAMGKISIAIPIPNILPEEMSISLGFDEKGRIEIVFSDPIDLGQNDDFLTPEAFPHGGEKHGDRNSLWMSMFMRHINESQSMNNEIDDG